MQHKIRKETMEQTSREQGLVSVIIPTYNRMGTLERSVQSVLAQTYRAFELLIIDDASTDATEQYINGIEDERIRYYRNESNIGPAASRNRGVSLAVGEYLAFQDSDDEWMPDKLQKMMELLAGTDEKVGMAYHEMLEAENERSIIPSRGIPLADKAGDIFSYMLLYPLIGVPATLIKKRCFEACGGFDARIQCFEDYEFFLRMAKDYEILFQQEPLILIHDTPGSVNKRYREKIDTELFVLETHFDALLQYGILQKKIALICLQAENYDEEAYFYEKATELTEKIQEDGKAENEKRASLLLESISRAACRGREKGTGDRSMYYQNAASQLSHLAESLARLALNIQRDTSVLAKSRGAIRQALLETAEDVAGYVDLAVAPAKEKDILNGISHRLEGWESDAKSYDALLELEKEVRTLLEQLGQMQHFCTVCGSHVRFLPFSSYNKVMRMHYGYQGKDRFLFEEGPGDCCPVCGASQKVRFLLGFLEDVQPEANEKLRICYRKAQNEANIGMAQFLKHYIEGKTYLAEMDLEETGTGKADVIICTDIPEKTEEKQTFLKELFCVLSVNGIAVILPSALGAADNEDMEAELGQEQVCGKGNTFGEHWKRYGLAEPGQSCLEEKLRQLSEEAGFEVQSIDREWFGKEYYEQYGFGEQAKLFLMTKRSGS